jgi:hypothetical protein
MISKFMQIFGVQYVNPSRFLVFVMLTPLLNYLTRKHLRFVYFLKFYCSILQFSGESAADRPARVLSAQHDNRLLSGNELHRWHLPAVPQS